MEYLRVEQGLNTLASVSKSIREGNIAGVPSIFANSAKSIGNTALSGLGSSIEQGANAVLGQVGINPTLLSSFGISSHDITTKGVNMAKSVFNDVISGDFSFSSITDTVKAPFENLTDLLGNQENKGSIEGAKFAGPSPYATDKSLSDNHPKFKFLFVAEFIFADDFQEALGENGNNMAFVVRTASRPNINIEYEDINMYNFKTKVPKYTEYQPIRMSFFDDQSNQTTSFYKKYSELLIPNMSIPELATTGYETSSFNFSNDHDSLPFNSSSLQPLSGKSGHVNIIKTIRLFHIWGWGQYVNVYKFHNPKLTEINISDLDMDSNEFAEIEIQFSYDGLNIETTVDSEEDTNANISLDPKSQNSGGYNVPQYSIAGNQGKYPLHYNGDSSNPKKMNGPNTPLPDVLKAKALDIGDFTNPNASDSDFLGDEYLKDKGMFPDFNKLLSTGIDIGTNLLKNSGHLNTLQNTLNQAQSVFGGKLPNINNASKLFGNPAITNLATSLIGQISNKTPTKVPPATDKQLSGDFTSDSPDSDFL